MSLCNKRCFHYNVYICHSFQVTLKLKSDKSIYNKYHIEVLQKSFHIEIYHGTVENYTLPILVSSSAKRKSTRILIFAKLKER